MLNKFNKIRSSREEGFALTELLTVVIIIGVITAIALPIFINQQKAALQAQVKSDVRNLVTSINTMLVKYPNAVSGTAGTDNWAGSQAWDTIHQQARAMSGNAKSGDKQYIICRKFNAETGILHHGLQSVKNGYAVVGFIYGSGEPINWVYGFDALTGKYGIATTIQSHVGED